MENGYLIAINNGEEIYTTTCEKKAIAKAAEYLTERPKHFRYAMVINGKLKDIVKY